MAALRCPVALSLQPPTLPPSPVNFFHHRTSRMAVATTEGGRLTDTSSVRKAAV